MSLLLFAGALLSFLYFLFLIGYTGAGSSFSYIWLMFAILLMGGWVVRKYLFRPFSIRLPLWLKVSLITTAMLAVCLFLFVEGLVIHSMFLSYPDNLDYVIVLGAQVKGEQVTKSLAMRLDKALEYNRQNDHVIFVVSGGQGADEVITEAEAMKRYLVAGGVEKERIIMEGHSENTNENMKNSFSYIVVNWYGREEWVEGVNPKVGVISNNFHIFRARSIARKQGFSKISGIPAKADLLLLPNQVLREFFALLKDWMVGNI